MTWNNFHWPKEQNSAVNQGIPFLSCQSSNVLRLARTNKYPTSEQINCSTLELRTCVFYRWVVYSVWKTQEKNNTPEQSYWYCNLSKVVARPCKGASDAMQTNHKLTTSGNSFYVSITPYAIITFSILSKTTWW